MSIIIIFIIVYSIINVRGVYCDKDEYTYQYYSSKSDCTSNYGVVGQLLDDGYHDFYISPEKIVGTWTTFSDLDDPTVQIHEFFFSGTYTPSFNLMNFFTKQTTTLLIIYEGVRTDKMVLMFGCFDKATGCRSSVNFYYGTVIHVHIYSIIIFSEVTDHFTLRFNTRMVDGYGKTPLTYVDGNSVHDIFVYLETMPFGDNSQDGDDDRYLFTGYTGTIYKSSGGTYTKNYNYNTGCQRVDSKTGKTIKRYMAFTATSTDFTDTYCYCRPTRNVLDEEETNWNFPDCPQNATLWDLDFTQSTQTSFTISNFNWMNIIFKESASQSLTMSNGYALSSSNECRFNQATISILSGDLFCPISHLSTSFGIEFPTEGKEFWTICHFKTKTFELTKGILYCNGLTRDSSIAKVDFMVDDDALLIFYSCIFNDESDSLSKGEFHCGETIFKETGGFAMTEDCTFVMESLTVNMTRVKLLNGESTVEGELVLNEDEVTFELGTGTLTIPECNFEGKTIVVSSGTLNCKSVIVNKDTVISTESEGKLKIETLQVNGGI